MGVFLTIGAVSIVLLRTLAAVAKLLLVFGLAGILLLVLLFMAL